MTTDSLTRPSRGLLACFAIYLRWYVGRHFRAMRLAHRERFPVVSGPLIIFSNHASWWDPLTFLILSRRLLPTAQHYAPMDAAALGHYRVLRQFGIFPLDTGTPRGAVQLLRAAGQMFSTPGSVLWLTPEGRFNDVRKRPAVLRPGLAALVARLGNCTLLPMAAEYTFWDERLPEILLSFGEPIVVAAGSGRTSAEWSEQLARVLEQTQEELATLAQTRNPANFSTLLSGRVGISGVYEGWHRLRAALGGPAYRNSHAQAAVRASQPIRAGHE